MLPALLPRGAGFQRPRELSPFTRPAFIASVEFVEKVTTEKPKVKDW